MKRTLSLATLFVSLSFLVSCQKTGENEKASINTKAKNTLQALTPREVKPSSKNLIKASYLKDVLPESAYIYARIPNSWSLVGGPNGNVFDKALSSKPYVDAFSSIKEGFGKEVVPELPDDAKPMIAFLFNHTTSPIEIAAMVPVLEKESPFPNVLLTTAVNFKDIESFKQFFETLAEKSPKIDIKKAIQADGTGEIAVDRISAQLKFDMATNRLFLLSGMKLQDKSLEESLKLLKPNTTHAMKALESNIDSSGQGLFLWADPQKVLQLANLVGGQRQTAPLAMLGVNSIKNIAFGYGTSNGINQIKFILDMPKTGFRGFIPTIQDAPNFRLAGDTNFVVTLGLPSKSDFVSIESTAVGMTADKSQEYYDFKKVFAEKVGIEIEEFFDLFGQDLSVASDESGTYTAIRLKDVQKFNTLLADLVKKYDLKHEKRTISGQEYQHLVIPSFASYIEEMEKGPSSKNNLEDTPLLKRFMSVPGHLYWQQEDGYLIMASLPQVLMDRHYASPQITATEWFEKEQRTSPKGALLMATMRNKGVPASMYRAKLAVLAFLGNFVGRPIDMFTLPSTHEANLPKEGAFGAKLTSTENQFALEFSFESNPAEVLFAGNGYAGVAVMGILASIAMPAYEEYTLRAQVAEGLAKAKFIKSVFEKLSNDKNLDEGVDSETINREVVENYLPAAHTKEHSVTIDPDSGNIVIKFTHRRLRSDLILMKPVKGQTRWKCKSNISRKFLPAECK